MASAQDEAVCVRLWDWSETSQTVSLLAREHGLIRGIAKGAKREKGSFSGGFELLTRGELHYIPKPEGRLATLTSWDLTEVFPGLRGAISAYYAGSYAADVVHHVFQEGDPHPTLYDALVELLGRLGGGANADARALLMFQWILLREAGYRPDVGEEEPLAEDEDDQETLSERPSEGEGRAWFVPDRGEIVESEPSGPSWRVRPGTVRALRRLASTGRIAADASSTDRANRLLAAYLRAILDREPASMRFLFPPNGTGGPR
ncbi:MAG: DNA repair protein RecO [Planctomycetota bacterium]